MTEKVALIEGREQDDDGVDRSVTRLTPTGGRNCSWGPEMKAVILHPFDPLEAISITEAASRASKSDRTIRNWCRDHRIGRRIAGQWAVSAVALDMLLAGDDDSLQAYLAGDRLSDRVVSYYGARSIRLPAAASDFTDFAAAGEARK